MQQKIIYFTKRELDRMNFSSALKPRELLQKNQGHVADRPVALFGDNQLGFPGYLLFSFFFRLVVLCADKQADDIRVLFDRTGLAEVAQAWFSIAAQLWLPVKLGDHDDRDA